MTELINQSMSNEADCRTGLATPGLLITLRLFPNTLLAKAQGSTRTQHAIYILYPSRNLKLVLDLFCTKGRINLSLI